jgi:hypothetical protein
MWLRALRSLLNDQLVRELYGEIRDFCFTIAKHSYEIQVLVGKGYVSFWTEHAKIRKRAT